MTAKEAEDFRSSLCDLTVNSKPLISMLTMLAEESSEHAEQIVQVIENHILKAKPTEKLPSLYLIDSILKNLRTTDYLKFFQRNIVNVFCDVFDKVGESTRQAMFKLRQTWSKGDMLPARKLYALDVRVNQIDPAWPVVPLPDPPPNSIHVNPKFLPQNDKTKPAATASSTPSTSTRQTEMTKVIAEQRRQLEEINQKRMELELAKAQAQIEVQKQELAQLQAKLQTTTEMEEASNGSDVPTDPRLRISAPSTQIPQDPRQPQQPVKSHLPTDPRKPSAILPVPVPQASHTISTNAAPNIPIPGGKVAEPGARGDKPLATSVGALLSQAASGQSSSSSQVQGRKGSKLPKLRELDKEDVNERGFSSRRGNDRPFNRRDQWNRGRSHGYRAPERQLPYERPGVNDNPRSKDGADSSSRRRRRERSRSHSRSSSRSRSRSRSPRRDSKKSSKRKDSSKVTSPKTGGKRSADAPPKTDQSKPSSSISVISKDTKPSAVSSSSTSELSSSAMDISTESESTLINKSLSDSKPSEESSGKKEGKEEMQKEDAHLKKRKRSPESKKRIDSKSPDPTTDKKKSRRNSPTNRPRSPSQGKSSFKKKSEGAHDVDMRKGATPVAVMDKDEDLRTNREKMRDQWQASKVKQMPRIPKRTGKNKPQYRERDDTSPVDDSLDKHVDGPPLGMDEVEVGPTSKADLDLRALPVVRAPSRSDTDSSDSDAEVLADITKRRKERSKIVEGRKASKEKGAKHKSHNDSDDRRQKKQHKSKKHEETFDEDEDFRIRPPVPKSNTSSERKGDSDLRKPLKVDITKGGADEDLDMRVPPSPASHGGWNKFKKDNPNDFYTPNKVPPRRQREVVPLYMNDKGLDFLDQKDLILKQAEIQYNKKEITRKQFDEVKHRFQELELIKRAHKVKASSMLMGDRHQHRLANPYDQRGGGPMVIQRQRQTPQANLRPLFDPQMVSLLRAIQKNSDDPRVRRVLNNLQGGSSPLGRRDSAESILSSGQNSPIGRGGGLLPTPDISGSQQSPNFLHRTDSFGNRSQDGCYEFIIDGQAFELPLNMQARKIPIGGKTCRVLADPENREIIIDGSCYYKIGDRVRNCYIGGCKHKISYHGPYVNFWVDQMQKEIRVDAPPTEISFNGIKHFVQVEGHTNTLVIDGQSVGMFGGPAREILVGGQCYFISFEPPAREILIDGDLCRLKSDGPVPLVIIHNKVKGIRFEGRPREIFIDDMPFMVPLDETIRVKVGMRSHKIGFGGPGQEVVIDGKPYEVMFGGPPRMIKIGGTVRGVRLPGEPPEVKILGEVIPDDMTSVGNNAWPNTPVPPLAPPPRPPIRGLLPTPPSPSTSHQPPPFFNADSDMRRRPHVPDYHDQRSFPHRLPNDFHARPHNPRDPRTQSHHDQDMRPPYHARDGADMPRPSFTNYGPDQARSSSQDVTMPKSLDISNLVSGLIKHGLLNQKKDEEKEKVEPVKKEPALPKMDDVPDLTSLTDLVLKKLYSGVVQRLYTGNQCATCGLRFHRSAEKEYSDHLDWHFRQNTRDKNKSTQSVSRLWYIQSEDWVSYDEFSDIAESNVFLDSQPETNTSTGTTVIPPEAVMCPKAIGTEENDSCCVCREPFERFWNDEEEEWHLKDAVRVEDKTYHPVCYEDAVENSIMDTGEDTSVADSVPPSPRSSVAQSPAALLSPRTSLSTPATTKEGEGKQKEPPSSASAPPATAFDLLSGLISKTEAKAGSTSPQQVSKDDPLHMLAGLMKSVKPPPAVDQSSAAGTPSTDPPAAVLVKEEAVEGEEALSRQTSVESKQLSVKTEVAVKEEPVETPIESIGTLGGLSVPTVVKSNVTLLQPSQDQPASADPPPFVRGEGVHPTYRPDVPPPTQPLRLAPPRTDQMVGHQQMGSANEMNRPRVPQVPQMSIGGGPSHQQHVHPLVFRGPPSMAPQTTAFSVPPHNSVPSLLMNRPQSMVALAGAPPHMRMSTMLPVVQQEEDQEDEGTPVRDELTDDVARCPTPVMDEPGEDGGSTPVRDERD